MIPTTTLLLGEFAFTADLAGPDDGDPVLMLHGFPQSRRAWASQLEVLAAAGYRGGAASLRARDVPAAGQCTLYAWGDADTTVGRVAAEATADFVTGPYRFEIIPGAGHVLTDEVPETVNRLLLAHLAQASV